MASRTIKEPPITGISIYDTTSNGNTATTQGARMPDRLIVCWNLLQLAGFFPTILRDVLHVRLRPKTPRVRASRIPFRSDPHHISYLIDGGSCLQIPRGRTRPRYGSHENPAACFRRSGRAARHEPHFQHCLANSSLSLRPHRSMFRPPADDPINHRYLVSFGRAEHSFLVAL